MYVLYVCKECILCLSVYECRNKAKLVCLLCAHTLDMKYDSQCQDNRFHIIIYLFQDSCDADVAHDDEDDGLRLRQC